MHQLDPLVTEVHSESPEPKRFASCALPNLFSDEHVENQLGPHGWSSSFTNKQGLRIASYYWPALAGPEACGVCQPASRPRGTVVMLHGHGAYLLELLKAQGPGRPSLYEGSWVQLLNVSGFAVCGIDSQSCGFSEGISGLRNYFESFDDLVADVIQFRRSLDAEQLEGFCGVPTFIMGMSMGGALAVQTIRAVPELFCGAVLLAPMLSLERVSKKGFNPYLRPLAGLISTWLPWLPIVAVHRSKDPVIQEEWDAGAAVMTYLMHPLVYHGNTRARNAAEFLRVTEDIVRSMDSMDFPFIALHGDIDTLCDPDGSRQLFERSAADDKEFVLLPGMWHILVKEAGNEQVIAQVAEWLTARS